MPPLASAVEPEQTVSRSRTTTRPTRSRARWYAVLAPMIPAPMMTTSAVSVIDTSMRDGLQGHRLFAGTSRLGTAQPHAKRVLTEAFRDAALQLPFATIDGDSRCHATRNALQESG